MILDIPTVVYRHRRENLKKCSLRGLEARKDFRFFTYPKHPLPPLENYILLAVDGEPLSQKDSTSGLLLVDATWRLAEVMLKNSPTLKLPRRSIPSHFRTAYPRRQEDCKKPDEGLASIEALYIAFTLLGKSTENLLDNYHWRDLFLEKNHYYLV